MASFTADDVSSVTRNVDAIADQLITLSHGLSADPELSYEEHRAAARCADLMEEHGFDVERAIYGLPPEDVGGEAANSLTYATVEGNERRRAQRVSAPWCARIEQALTAQTPRPVVIKFNLDATVRADLATRMAAHAVALDNGVRTLSEVRVLEDLAPLTPEQWDEWAQWQAARGKSSAMAPAPDPEADDPPDEGTTA